MALHTASLSTSIKDGITSPRATAFAWASSSCSFFVLMEAGPYSFFNPFCVALLICQTSCLTKYVCHASLLLVSGHGNRLREIREIRGLSARDIAVALDLTEASVIRLEKPEANIPTKHIRPLRTLLEVETDYLLGLDRDSKAEASA